MLTRRTVLAGTVSAAWVGMLGAVHAQDRPKPAVIVVSRERVLRETKAGLQLRAAERELSADFQAQVDAVKAEIEAEEEEIATQRAELSRDEFERRAARFDRKVRIARRRSQRRAAELQQAVRAARDELIAALGPILIDVLRAEGAEIVLDADQVLIAAPTVNMTDAVIQLFDERVGAPALVLPDEEPLLPTAEELDAAVAEPGLGD